jgi:hypothetical protein
MREVSLFEHRLGGAPDMEIAHAPVCFLGQKPWQYTPLM